MSRDKQMQVKKLHEQQGIKPVTKQIRAEARIAALKAQLGINSMLEEGDAKQEGESPKEQGWGRNRGNPVVTCKALNSKCMELG